MSLEGRLEGLHYMQYYYQYGRQTLVEGLTRME
jgi:hypothetical protein